MVALGKVQGFAVCVAWLLGFYELCGVACCKVECVVFGLFSFVLIVWMQGCTTLVCGAIIDAVL